MSERRLFRFDLLITILFLGVISWGGFAWLKKHRQEASQEEATKEQTAEKTGLAKAALARLRSTWDADDSWKHQVYPSSGDPPSYSLDVEHALATGRPIIVVGEILDVQSSKDQSAPLVLIQSDSGSTPVDLRFSLAATPQLADAILSATRNNAMADIETFIVVASVQNVEKVERPPDKADNDQDYFLAHGTLQEAYDTHLLMLEPKDLGEN